MSSPIIETIFRQVSHCFTAIYYRKVIMTMISCQLFGQIFRLMLVWILSLLYSTTGVKLCTFRWLISHDIAQKEMVLNSSIIHHLIIITCISYEIIFTKSLPKLINIAPFQTCVIHVTDSIRHCNADYSGLEWSNINIHICILVLIWQIYFHSWCR